MKKYGKITKNYPKIMKNTEKFEKKLRKILFKKFYELPLYSISKYFLLAYRVNVEYFL